MNAVSVVIVYRNSLQDKEDNLNFIIDYYNSFNCSEIIIVEQDTIPKYINKKNTKHIFCFNPSLFNRSWGFNVGMCVASNEKIIFADIDCYLNVEEMKSSIQLLDIYDVVKPYNRFCMLDLESSICVKKNIPTNYIFENVVGTNYGAGILFGNKTSILRIGSWPEEFEGWGGEDDVMSIKIRHKLSYTNTTNDLFHLYHERTPTISSNGHEKYEFNRRQALEIVPRMSKGQLNDYIEIGKRTNLGNINKYKDDV